MATIPRDRGAVAVPRPVRAWALPIGLAAYVLVVTRPWEFPASGGVPFPVVWAAASVASFLAWRRWRGEVGPVEASAIVVMSAMLLTDITVFLSQGHRDLALYLKAGQRFLAGEAVYLETVLVRRPGDLSDYPFLYPPLTLPLFAVLSVLPQPLVAGAWIAGSLVAALASFRLIGIGPRWSILLLLWPPVLQGLYVGNVAVPLLLLFAAAPRVGGGLVAAVAFKLYNAVAALWLVRERRWRELAAGLAGVAGVAALTAPFVGWSLWADWVEGLRNFQASQQILPEYLYGYGLGRYLPLAVVAAIGVSVTILALRGSDSRERLLRLGIATTVASPSVFSHGFLVGLPAFLTLRTNLVWLVLGVTACAPGLAWWIAPAVAMASWFFPGLRRQGQLPAKADVAAESVDPWHPLGAALRPWPDWR